MPEKLDIVLFGATGFTGKHTLPIIAKYAKIHNLTWGVAGRSEKKLRDVLNEYKDKIVTDLENIPVIIADVKNEESIYKMVKQARLIINCCGPYRFFGEPVVKACVEEGTHHVDVSGEIQFMELMQLKYHKKAEENGVYIISACGFESIPYDLGVVFLQDKFPGTLNSVEAYLNIWDEKENQPGPIINYGTWNSAINVLRYAKELKVIRKQLFPDKLPKFVPKLKTKVFPHKVDEIEGWAAPVHSTDRTVINRTQRYFYEQEAKRPIQIETYFIIKSFLYFFMIILGGLVVLVLSKFDFGVKLLLKYPKLFTLGYVSDESPSEDTIENNRFCLTLVGKGWSEKLANVYYEYPTLPNKSIVAKINGFNIGYGTTCFCLVLAGLTIVTESEKMPKKGGVFPPGYAFAKTSLIKQLNENGITFTITGEKDL